MRQLIVLISLAFSSFSCNLFQTSANTTTAQIQTIAKAYGKYTKFSKRLAWAPVACAPMSASIERPTFSKADEAHGQKLHYLYVKDFASYQALHTPALLRDFKQKEGQVLVKESFQPVKVLRQGRPAENYQQKDGKWFKRGEKLNLFIMYKEAANEKNDMGWVYAVTSADGSKVLEQGKVASCAGCHQNAKNDRLFGQK